MSMKHDEHDDDGALSDGNRSEDWNWDIDGIEEEPIKDLISNQYFNNIDELIKHNHETFGFDLREVMSKIGANLDEIEMIMMINFIRSWFLTSQPPIDQNAIDNLKAELGSGSHKNAMYMKPTLENDALLHSIHILSGQTINDDEDEGEKKQHESKETEASTVKLNEILATYKATLSNIMSDSETTMLDRNSDYFRSYSNVYIHETMLKDEPRMTAYSTALSTEYMKGKTVLDVGCGSGILCMLAARAGAAKIIGIEFSEEIATMARKIIAKNGFSDRIQIIQGQMENVVLPFTVDKSVDVIISEWMGYGLYFENMLPSVLFARDKYLRPQGLVLPSTADLFAQGITSEASDDRVSWWGNVEGFDFSDLTGLVTSDAQVQMIEPLDILSDRHRFHTLDIATATNDDLDFERPFELVSLIVIHFPSIFLIIFSYRLL